MYPHQPSQTTHLARWMVIVALLGALLSGPTVAQDEAAQRQKLEQLSGETSKLRKLLSIFKGQRNNLQSDLQKSEIDIGKLQAKIRQIQQQLQREQDGLQSLQRRRKQLQSARQQQQAFIEQQILAAYQVGQQKKLKILLNQENPDKVSRALAYYDYLNQARAQQINSYIDVINELDSLEPQILDKTRSLTRARQQLSDEHDKLLLSKQQREQSLAKIDAAIQTNDQRLQQLNKDRSELEKLLNAVEKTLANISIPGDFRPFHNLKGQLPWPINGQPANRFGQQRNGTALRWQGLSIPATEGSTVTAIHHGRIVFSDWLRGSGLLVIIDHGNGYMSLYAHNQSLLKETGDWVNPGDIIATVGNSGGQRRAGLYFEIRHNGKPTDPRQWCKRA